MFDKMFESGADVAKIACKIKVELYNIIKFNLFLNKYGTSIKY